MALGNYSLRTIHTAYSPPEIWATKNGVTFGQHRQPHQFNKRYESGLSQPTRPPLILLINNKSTHTSKHFWPAYLCQTLHQVCSKKQSRTASDLRLQIFRDHCSPKSLKITFMYSSTYTFLCSSVIKNHLIMVCSILDDTNFEICLRWCPDFSSEKLHFLFFKW